MPTSDQSTKFILALDDAEHAELLALLEQELRETRVEARRTESPDYQDEVHDPCEYGAGEGQPPTFLLTRPR
jgi:hypothetical protein